MRFLKYLLILTLTLGSLACSKETPDPDPMTGENALLVYIAADNSLYSYATDNIESMTEFLEANDVGNNKVIIYADEKYDSDSSPELFELQQKSNGSVEMKTIKVYEDQDSSSPDVLTSVLNDFFNYVTADTYSLILWSHGTGWMPHTSSRSVSSRSVLQDESNWMEITELSSALPDGVFDFILFDACLMGSIEVAYELKDKCNYLMGSPAEILGEGMPYRYILKDIFSNDYCAACYTYYEYYASKSSYQQAATAGVYDMSKIDALALSFKNIIAQYESSISSLSISSIQRYRQTEDYVSFDFLDFVQKLIPDQTDSLRLDFEDKFNDFVIASYHTDKAYDGGTGYYYSLFACNGISSYIPVYTSLNTYFEQTSWYKATYL